MVWDVVGCCTTRFYDVQIANYYKLNRLVAPLLHMHLALLSKFTIYNAWARMTNDRANNVVAGENMDRVLSREKRRNIMF